jgi:GTP pyrophosphokinase
MADRLHNMRTLQPLPPEKRRGIALETLQIFAPLAHRLGVWRLKWELEDLCLRELEPEAYREIVRKIARERRKREALAENAADELREHLRKAGVEAEVFSRSKHIYSIHQKMKTQGVDFSQILDLLGLRVVVSDTNQCYAALGQVHSLWPPLDGMFYDYISRSKPNMYQSLHTKVMGPGGPMEVQIRTWDMHRTAEYGVASHWLYKEGGKEDEAFEQKLAWLRRMLDLQSDAKDASEWLEALKVDLFKDQVFVFTPKGDIIDLPIGATAIDFAYRIHTDVGHRCVGAKANGTIVNLDYQLKNGDAIEILTSKGPGRPSLDWLKIAATTQAKAKIKQWYRRQTRDENIRVGREHLEQECRRLGVTPAEVLQSEGLEEVARRMNYTAAEDLLAAVGYGEAAAETVMHRLREAGRVTIPDKPVTIPRRRGKQARSRVGVSAAGLEDLLVTLSRCCAPSPGDTIAGYVTRGKGVAVHRTDCPNIMAAKGREPDRIIPLAWSPGHEDKYQVPIDIEAMDRVGLLNDLLAVTSANSINIVSAKAKTLRRTGTALIRLVLEVTSLDQLHGVLERFRNRSDVIRAGRPGTA